MKKIKDERLELLNSEVIKEAYYVIISILCLSILIKIYAFNVGFSQVATELVAIILSGAYISVRSAFVGLSEIDSLWNSKKISIIVDVFLGLIITIATGFENYSKYGEHYTTPLDIHFLAVLGIIFVSSTLFLILIDNIVKSIIKSVNKSGKKRLDRKIDDMDKK